MSTVHFILQGKGGVGKSVIAALLAQYLHDKNMTVRCVDADPLNKTLAGFEALKVAKVDLLEKSERGGERINPHRFDELVELIAAQGADSHVIVDAGSSAFIALVHYIVTNEVVALLTKTGHEVFVHTLVTRGTDAPRHASWSISVSKTNRRRPVCGMAESVSGAGRGRREDIRTDEGLPGLEKANRGGDFAFTLMSRHRLTKAQSEFYSRLDSLAV